MSIETTQEGEGGSDKSVTLQPTTLSITQEKVGAVIQDSHPVEYSTFSGVFRFLREIDPNLIDRLGGAEVILEVFSDGTDDVPYGEFRGFVARWYKIHNGQPRLLPPSERNLLGHIRRKMNLDSWIRLPDGIANGHFMIFHDQYTDIEVVPLAKLPGTLCDHEITQSDLCYEVTVATRLDYILSTIISPIFNAYPQINRIFLQTNGRGYIVPRDMLTEESKLADFIVAKQILVKVINN